MAEHSSIEWTDATWNIITGCTLVDEGCRHCYAATLAATRLKNHPSRAGLARLNAAGEAKFTGEVRFNEQWLNQPIEWKRPRLIFVCAHGDLFHEGVSDEWLDRVFAVMALASRHTFQVLTKRPDRAAEYLARNIGGTTRRDWVVMAVAHHTGRSRVDGFNWPLPNVWLGTSVHDQASADLRIPQLMAAPAAVRFLSAEPLLGPIDLPRFGVLNREVRADFPAYLTRRIAAHPGVHRIYRNPYGARYVKLVDGDLGIKPDEVSDLDLDWVIVGGESGPKARPMSQDWARSLRDQCRTADVPFLFKQWGEWVPMSKAEAEGLLWSRSMPPIAALGGAVVHVGKKAAGRGLDGMLHNGMPRGAK